MSNINLWFLPPVFSQWRKISFILNVYLKFIFAIVAITARHNAQSILFCVNTPNECVPHFWRMRFFCEFSFAVVHLEASDEEKCQSLPPGSNRTNSSCLKLQAATEETATEQKSTTKHWRESGVSCLSNFSSSTFFSLPNWNFNCVNILSLFVCKFAYVHSLVSLFTLQCCQIWNFFFLAVYLHALLAWIFKEKKNWKRETISNSLPSVS